VVVSRSNNLFLSSSLSLFHIIKNLTWHYL
jgi:hypothetical protein